MRIARLERPSSIDEARRLIAEDGGVPIGGGVWMRMGQRSIGLGVDLSGLGLRYIRKAGGRIEIGAMATARDVETSELILAELGPALRDATAHIVGVQLRNLISIGGSIAGRFGFSDIATTLLALGARVSLYGAGELPLEDYLAGGAGGSGAAALVTAVAVEAGGRRSAFKSVRNTAGDLAILNAAAAYGEAGWRVAVGARPGAARLSAKAAEILGADPEPDAAKARAAGEAAAAELAFGDDIRGDAAYRRSVCEALVRRAVEGARR